MPRSFVIPGKTMSLNEYRNTHYHKQSAEKRLWEERILLTLKGLKWPAKLKTPIYVKATVKTVQPRDHENCILAIKYINDALVIGGYIKDDRYPFVEAIGIGWKKTTKKNLEQVEFEITES